MSSTRLPEDEPWLTTATSPAVVRRALFYMLVVGPVLISINHGDAIVDGEVDGARLWKMALTLAVPYCVSTLSTVGTLRALRARGPAR